MRHLVAVAALVLLCLSSFGQQQRAARDPKVEQKVRDKLAAIAPQAVDSFQRATEAMDTSDYQAAIPLFQQVLQQAPSFTPAMRRLGASLAGSGKVDEGLTYCRSAVQIERSPENLSNLAGVLSYPAPNQQGSAAQTQEALPLAKEANDNYHGNDASYPLLVATRAQCRERQRVSSCHRDSCEAASRTATPASSAFRTHPERASLLSQQLLNRDRCRSVEPA